MKVTLEQWRMLATLVQTQSYAKAGERLHKNPSAIHHAIKKLSEDLRVNLVESQGKRVQLTAEGQRVMQQVESLLWMAERVESLVTQGDGDLDIFQGVVSELMNPQVFYNAPLFAQAQSLGANWQIYAGVLDEVQQLWQSHNLSFAISDTLWEPQPKEAQVYGLGSVALHLVVGKQHPLAVLPHIDALDMVPYVQLVVRGAHNSIRAGGWLHAQQKIHVAHMSQALAGVVANVGFCWLPAHYIADALAQQQLVCLDVQPQWVPLVLYCRKSMSLQWQQKMHQAWCLPSVIPQS